MNQLQQKAIDLVKNGENIFLTGRAGCGKTTCLREIINWATQSDINIGIASSTGVSAILIGGRTIHSLMGFGLGKDTMENLVTKAKRYNKPAVNKLKEMQILIIDEISMIDSVFFDKISKYMSIIRGKYLFPFSGVQIILTGDFAQLSSVEGDKYCFQSETWKELNIQTVDLKESMRHKDDQEFDLILKELRWGRMTKPIFKKLKRTKNNVFDGDIKPTILYSKNVDVDKINNDEYEKLIREGAPHETYHTRYSSNPDCKKWADSNKVPEWVSLCIGSQVMLTWNTDIDAYLVNGSRGVVTDIAQNGVYVTFMNGNNHFITYFKVKSEEDDSIYVELVPLKLAYSITINKSQGATLDCIEVELGKNIFTWGQSFTALSRVRSLNSVRIFELGSNSFQCHPEVLKFYGEPYVP